MVAATDDVDTARKDYQAARAKVLANLKADPAYQAAAKDQSDVQAKLHEEQAKTDATQPATTRPLPEKSAVPNLPTPSSEQVAIAQDKLDNKAKLRNLEDTAVSQDPDASKAQAKLNAAEKSLKLWQAQLDAALKNDPDYRAALDQMTAARAHMAAAAGTPNAGSGY